MCSRAAARCLTSSCACRARALAQHRTCPHHTLYLTAPHSRRAHVHGLTSACRSAPETTVMFRNKPPTRV
eukprot:1069318-Rhodomonas_salina.1